MDGTSQPGGKVELSGGDGDGLVLDGSGVEVRGLVVTGFAGAGLVLGGDGGHSVASSWIGVGPDGSGTAGNTEAGIRVESRSEEHTSELQSLMRISYAVF